jgi:hypothetical protein
MRPTRPSLGPDRAWTAEHERAPQPCALATGNVRDDRCVACGAPVRRSRHGLAACAASACFVYGDRKAA